MPASSAIGQPFQGYWRFYFELTKPRVVGLMLFTALVGMVLSIDAAVPWTSIIFGLVGIGLASMAGAAINHVVDQHIDAVMLRTCSRPLPSGHIDSKSASLFAVILAAAAMLILVVWVNTLTAVLTFLAMIGYAVIYTLLLKRSTPQNIVWGGAAGAAPPLLGATTVTGQLTLDAMLLFLIVFVWTPPHFWPLAIAKQDDYRNAGVPMLPLTHGVAFTKAQILYYSVMLLTVSILPFVVRSAGFLYLAGALALGVVFIYRAWRLYSERESNHAMAMFGYSIFYLFALFALMIADRFLPLV